MVFRYGVVAEYGTGAPLRRASETSASRRKPARSPPSNSNTESRASSHSRVSRVSKSSPTGPSFKYTIEPCRKSPPGLDLGHVSGRMLDQVGLWGWAMPRGPRPGDGHEHGCGPAPPSPPAFGPAHMDARTFGHPLDSRSRTPTLKGFGDYCVGGCSSALVPVRVPLRPCQWLTTRLVGMG